MVKHLKDNSVLQNGKYKIKRFISSGGFGCTYEADLVLLSKRVAIKEFFVKDFCKRDEHTDHVSVAFDEKVELVAKLRKKFIEEASILYSLQHPNIVRVSDIFEENGTAYYVMDYIEGKSLYEILQLRRSLDESETLLYLRQVADALNYVHAHNCLHLDIKPGNIMITSDGRAILIDFGASKQYDEVDGENTSTLLGKTPGYAPLEQMSNSVQKFTPSTDIYALGATLYRTLVGVVPPDATTILNEGLPELPSFLSTKIQHVIRESMRPRKSDRLQNIDEFLKLLEGDEEEEEETVLLSEKNKAEKIKKEESKSLKEHIGGEATRIVSSDNSESKNTTPKISWRTILGIFCFLCFIYWVATSSKKTENSIDSEQKNQNIEVVDADTLVEEYDDGAVDLGLSVKWANRNYRATETDVYGGSCCFYDLNESTKNIIEDDFGKGWRLPTRDEFKELFHNCYWEWTGKGFEITGPNNKSIFLPASGYGYGNNSSGRDNSCNYWTSTLSSYNGFFSFVVYNDLSTQTTDAYADRDFKFYIRPVLDKGAGTTLDSKNHKTTESKSHVTDKQKTKPVPKDTDEDEIYEIVEVMPEYPGGLKAMMEFLANNVRYPKKSQEAGHEGRVIVTFVVDNNGYVVNPTIVQSVDPDIDREALRVIKSMPKWKPAYNHNKAVNSKFTVPIMFRLQ